MCLLALEWLPRLFKMSLPLPRTTTQIFPGNVVRLTIPFPTNPLSKRLWSTWQPGSHVRIMIPSIGLFQTHPLTITSLPSDGKVVIYVRARSGFTRRVYERAAAGVISGIPSSLKVHFEGIYGGKFASFSNFDVVLLIAGGIGVTFTIPILREIVMKAKDLETQNATARCKRIGFVWIVRNKGSYFHEDQVDISPSVLVCFRTFGYHVDWLNSCCDEIVYYERSTR